MMVDVFGFKLSPLHTQRTALENIFALNKELELYNETLLDKPCILLLNKIDQDGSKEKVSELLTKVDRLDQCTDECPSNMASKRYMSFDRILEISAKDNLGIDVLKRAIRDVLDEHAERNRLQEDDSSAASANKETFVGGR